MSLQKLTVSKRNLAYCHIIFVWHLVCCWWVLMYVEVILKSVWSPYVIGQTIIFLPCGFYLFSFFFLAYSQRSEIGCLPYFHTWCGFSADLECMSEMCCMWLSENTGRKKSPFWHHRTTLSGCIFTAEACIDNRKKPVKHRYLLHMYS